MLNEYLNHSHSSQAFARCDSNVAKFIDALVKMVDTDYGVTHFCEARKGSFVFGHEPNSTVEPLGSDQIKQQLALFLYRHPEAARAGVFKFQTENIMIYINLDSIKKHLLTKPTASRNTFFGRRLKQALGFEKLEAGEVFAAAQPIRIEDVFTAWREHYQEQARQRFFANIFEDDSRRTPVESKGESKRPPYVIGGGAFAAASDDAPALLNPSNH